MHPGHEEADLFRVGSTRPRQFVAYGQKVYKLKDLLGTIHDGRQVPQTSSALVAAAVFFCGLLRIRSFNALEPRLSERPYMRLVGVPEETARLCSVDTVSRVLRGVDLATVRDLGVQMVARAERNKVFREGWHRAMRYVALDG